MMDNVPPRPSCRVCKIARWVIGVPLVIGSVGAAGAVWYRVHQSMKAPLPQIPAEQFLDAMAAGDWVKAAKDATPEVAVGIESAGKACPAAWGKVMVTSKTNYNSSFTVGTDGIHDNEHGSFEYTVTGTDDKKRLIGIEVDGIPRKIVKVSLDGVQILPPLK